MFDSYTSKQKTPKKQPPKKCKYECIINTIP